MTTAHSRTRSPSWWRLTSLLVATGSVVTSPPAAAAEGAPPSHERPSLRLSTADGQSSIRFRLLAQLRWEGTSTDEGADEGRDWSDRFLIRRLRLVLDGSVLTTDLTYRVQLSLAPGQIELVDLWVAYDFHPQARLLVGQNKVPFTRYRMNSNQDLPLVEWGLETPAFGAERQLGLTLHNGMSKPPELEYQVGLYTGVNARASNAVALARLFGDKPPNPSRLVDPAPPSSFHPELVGHFAYNHGGVDVRHPSDLEGGPFRFSVGLSAAWDVRPEDRLDMALRVAPEAMIKIGGFHALGVFYLAWWEPVASGGPLALGLLGGIVQASYVVVSTFELALRYSNVSILGPLRRDTRRYADARIAAETDPDARAELEERHRDTGLALAEHEVLLGFNFYLLGTALKLQIDTGLRLHERSDADRPDGLLRAQLQLAF